MKLVRILVPCVALLSASVYANGLGVVDMQKVFRTTKTVQSINSDLEKTFSPRKAVILKMNKDLQESVQNYQKNQAVMTQQKRETLQKDIAAHSAAIRQAQAKFQSDLTAVQNKKMGDFLAKVKEEVAQIAKKQKLDNVLPTSVLLYSQTDQDITDAVIEGLK